MKPIRSRVAVAAGVVSLAYVIWYIAGLILLEANPSAYTRANQAYGSLGARFVLGLVLIALLFHLFDGLRTVGEQLIPRLTRHDLGLRAAVRFCTFALWIPGALVLVWPAIRTWFAR